MMLLWSIKSVRLSGMRCLFMAEKRFIDCSSTVGMDVAWDLELSPRPAFRRDGGKSHSSGSLPLLILISRVMTSRK